MAKKRKIQYVETYKKNVPLKKERIIEWINKPETELFLLKFGSFDDGKGFVTLTIENI